MSLSFRIKRPLQVAASGFLILLIAERIKGHGWREALVFSAIWAAMSTAIFIGTMLYYARTQKDCPICNDVSAKPS